MFQIHAAAAEEDKNSRQSRTEQSSRRQSRGVSVPAAAAEELQFQASQSLTTWLLGYLADLVTAEVIVNAWS